MGAINCFFGSNTRFTKKKKCTEQAVSVNATTFSISLDKSSCSWTLTSLEFVMITKRIWSSPAVIPWTIWIYLKTVRVLWSQRTSGRGSCQKKRSTQVRLTKSGQLKCVLLLVTRPGQWRRRWDIVSFFISLWPISIFSIQKYNLYSAIPYFLLKSPHL